MYMNACVAAQFSSRRNTSLAEEVLSTSSRVVVCGDNDHTVLPTYSILIFFDFINFVLVI